MNSQNSIQPYREPAITVQEKPRFGIIPAQPKEKPHYCSKPRTDSFRKKSLNQCASWRCEKCLQVYVLMTGWFRKKGLNQSALWRCEKCLQVYVLINDSYNTLIWYITTLDQWIIAGGTK